MGFDYSIIRPDKLQKAKTRLQIVYLQPCCTKGENKAADSLSAALFSPFVAYLSEIDLHCLAVHQNTNKYTVEYMISEKSLAEKVRFSHLLSFFLSFFLLSSKTFRQA